MQDPRGQGEDFVLCLNSKEKPLEEQSRKGKVSILAFLKRHSSHSGKDRLGGQRVNWRKDPSGDVSDLK